MKAALQRDICGIQDLDMPNNEISQEVIDMHVPSDLRYACLYWVYHLSLNENDLVGEVSDFLHEHLLHWLEVLSLLGKASTAASILSELLTAVIKSQVSICVPEKPEVYINYRQNDSTVPPFLTDLIRDATRAVTSRQTLLEDAPLQVYSSMLYFLPLASIVRQVFWGHRFPHDCKIDGLSMHWNTHLQTLSGHREPINTLSFSPDGRLLASASQDSTIRLWDASSGAPRRTLRGHTGRSVDTLAFAPDSQALVSTSKSDVLPWLWDVNNGAGAPLQLRSWHAEICPLATAYIEPSQLATVYSDGLVYIWDVLTQTSLRVIKTTCPAQKHYLMPRDIKTSMVAISPREKLLALIPSTDMCAVQLWNLQTGLLEHTLQNIWGRKVMNFALSPDCKVLATCLDRLEVQVWDVSVGCLLHTLPIDDGHMIHVAVFSPDGRRLALAPPNECSLFFYDLSTGSFLRKVEGKSEWPYTDIAWSPDGQYVAARAPAYGLHIWDAITGNLRQLHLGFSIRSPLAISPDSRMLAPCMSSSEVQLCDATATSGFNNFADAHCAAICAIACSNDSQLVATGTEDGTIV